MLSVVITTWNEALNLPRVIASIKSIADEIIVVDTESTDDTVVVAKKLGCKVFRHKNTGIVEPVRNFSISKASGDWILLLDADEEVSPSLAKKIPQLISDPNTNYYRVPRQNLIFNKWIQSSHWWPDYVYRLFRKGTITWEDTIHSRPITEGVGIDLPADEGHAIIHHSYSTISQYVDRLNRYTDYQLSTKSTFIWTDVVTRPVSEFLTQYFARKGYQDGLHGLALSSLQAFSELVLYLKLWQTAGFHDTSVTPQAAALQLKLKKREYVWWLYQTKIDSSNFFKKIYYKFLRLCSRGLS